MRRDRGCKEGGIRLIGEMRHRVIMVAAMICMFDRLFDCYLTNLVVHQWQNRPKIMQSKTSDCRNVRQDASAAW